MKSSRGERGRSSYISRDNKDFQKDSAEQRALKTGGRDTLTFGAMHLDHAKRVEESMAWYQRKVAEGELDAQKAEKDIAFERSFLAGSVQSTFRRLREEAQQYPNMMRDIDIMLADAAKRQEVVEFCKQHELQALDAQSLFALGESKQVPTTVFLALLETRKERQEALQNEWEPIFEEYREDFRQKLHQAIEQGIIPPRPDYDERISETVFMVTDPLTIPVNNGEQKVGLYHGHGVISVDVESRDKQSIRNTLFHEMTHRIAGTVTQEILNEKFPGQNPRYRERKNGLRFTAMTKNVHHGNWLNEGITEIVALHLADANKTSSYIREQQTIWHLIKEGIPQELFIDAYFEERQTEDKPGSKLPAFLALHNAMTNKYGGNWLKSIQGELDRQ